MRFNHIKQNGIVYTPPNIVSLIFDHLNYKNILEKSIIDPSCGEGVFLVEALKRILAEAEECFLDKYQLKKLIENNLWGLDIDQRAIKVCLNHLNKIAAKYSLTDIKWNIYQMNSLDKSLISKFYGKFDFVVGNPPYIRIQHLGEDKRKKLQSDWQLCRCGDTDIFIAFFEMGINLLNPQGKLGYITPNTYLKTKAGADLRRYLKDNKLIKILIDFEHHQIFEKATTYSLITILDKEHKENTFRLFKGDKNNIKFVDEIEYENLNEENWILADNNILKRIREMETRGIPLGEIAEIHTGIATLADDYYIFKSPVFKDNYVEITLKDGRRFLIEIELIKPIVKVSVLKNGNEDQDRFIIFPYKKVNDKHSIISPQEMTAKYPHAYNYFKEIKPILDQRDRGKPNPSAWYAFGRSQGLDSSFGKKILVPPISRKPNFILWEREEYTFYAGYGIKYNGDLRLLTEILNSEDMAFYISHISRSYQNNYKSFAKSFLVKFGIDDFRLLKNHFKQTELLLDI